MLISHFKDKTIITASLIQWKCLLSSVHPARYSDFWVGRVEQGPSLCCCVVMIRSTVLPILIQISLGERLSKAELQHSYSKVKPSDDYNNPALRFWARSHSTYQAFKWYVALRAKIELPFWYPKGIPPRYLTMQIAFGGSCKDILDPILGAGKIWPAVCIRPAKHFHPSHGVLQPISPCLALPP